MSTLGLILFVTAGIIWGILMTHVAGSWFYIYSLEPDSIKIKIIGFIPVVTINYRDITSVELIPMWKANLYLPLYFVVRQGLRLWGGHAIRIHKIGGLLDTIIITPLDPVAMFETIENRRTSRENSRS